MGMYVYGIGALVFVAVTCMGGVLLSTLTSRRETFLQRLEGPERWADSEEESTTPAFLQALNSVGQALLPVASSQTTAEQLAQAGFYGQSAPAMFIGIKITLLIVGLVGGGIFILPKGFSPPLAFFLVVACGTLLCFVPNWFVELRIRQHRKRVSRRLPDVVDLLEICVSSGMGIDTAWNLIADEIRNLDTAIADEMVLANLEMHLGASRVTALRDMAERTGADAIDSLATMLVQSERFGTSISDTLRTFATAMREEESTRAQEEAEKVAVKMLFPMLFLVFPAFMTVVVGPAVIKIIRLFSQL